MDDNIAVHTEQILELKKSDTEQWKHINGYEKALSKLVPVWTTIVLMAMSGLTASALTFAVVMTRLTKS